MPEPPVAAAAGFALPRREEALLSFKSVPETNFVSVLSVFSFLIGEFLYVFFFNVSFLIVELLNVSVLIVLFLNVLFLIVSF